MCGIFGATGEPSWVLGLDLEAAVRAIRHRGPDGEGTFMSPVVVVKGAQRSAAFAHTRLSILDPTPSGRQPMSTGDGRYAITFNGEIYNFADIRAELVDEGVQFRSHSDTEVVLQAYVRWGREALGRFRGMFAFGIWDCAEGTLFLARDRLGVKPLYYWRSGNKLAFSSEVRGLLASGVSSRELSRSGLQSYLRTGSVAEPDTILEQVKALPAGHWVLVKGDTFVPESYWRPGQVPARTMSYAEAVEEVAPILRKAVQLRLVSDVPVGIFLSGGVDSSAVVGMAAQGGGGGLRTFNVCFDEKDYDEASFAAKVAEKYGAVHESIRLSGSSVLAQLQQGLRCQDQPSADGINTFVISSAVRAAGLKVALSGIGGDEVFAGYGAFRHFGAVLSAGRIGRIVPAGLRKGLLQSLGSAHISNRVRKAVQLGLSGGDVETVYSIFRQMYSPSQVADLLQEDWRTEFRESDAEETGRDLVTAYKADPVNHLSVLELSGYLRNTLLRDTDAMSMAHGLEVREPLLDHILIEKVLGIPGALKLNEKQNKPLLVDCVPGLAQALVNRPKMGFTLPLEKWFRSDLRKWCETTLIRDGRRAAGVLSQEKVSSLWKTYLKSPARVSFGRIATLLALVTWCDENGAGEPRST